MESESVSLESRTAKCLQCGKLRPSSASLPFFEYNGEGSRRATQTCKNCSYGEIAHAYGGNYYKSDKKNPYLCINRGKQFEPLGDSMDFFYCGCKGWD